MWGMGVCFGEALLRLSDGVVVVSAAGTVEKLNPTAEAWTGWCEAEARGLPLTQVLRLTDELSGLPIEDLAGTWMQAGQSRSTSGRVMLVSRDGTGLPVSGEAVPVRDAAGAICGALVVLRDLRRERASMDRDGSSPYADQLKRAEQARMEIAELYRLVFEASADGLLLTAPDGRIFRANPAACRMLGRTEQEIREAGRAGVVDLTDPRAGQAMEERARTGHVRAKVRMVRKDASKLVVDLTSDVFRDRNGELRTSMFLRDETERELMESALRRSEDQFRALFRNAPLAATIYQVIRDDEGTIVDLRVHDLNERSAEIFRHVGSELRGRSVSDLFTPESLPRIMDRATQVMTSGAPREFEEHFDEVQRDYLVVVFPLGTELYAVVAMDITERKKLEAQLRQSQRLESVGRLAGGVAHDFNNMLTVILGMTDLALGRKELPLGLAGDLEEVRAAAVSASHLTRQLLTFARKVPAEPRIVNLNETVGAILKMLRRVIGEAITIDWEPAEDPWLVRIDPAQLEQVLMNLALNARDAIDGPGRITVRAANEQVADSRLCNPETVPAGKWVELSVRDTGRGMDATVLDHAFEPFFTTKQEGKGTGLGLAIVYGIVKQNDGYVHVYSEPGRGTQFRIYLPRYEDGHQSESDDDDSGAPLEGGHETVLVVEDEALIMQYVGTALERMGYAVLTASSPAEALDRFEEGGGKIGLLLTDVVMPGMSGGELARELTARDPALRVLMMSGYSDAALLGAVEHPFLPKPFSRRELLTKVRAVLDATGGGAAGAILPRP